MYTKNPHFEKKVNRLAKTSLFLFLSITLWACGTCDGKGHRFTDRVGFLDPLMGNYDSMFIFFNQGGSEEVKSLAYLKDFENIQLKIHFMFLGTSVEWEQVNAVIPKHLQVTWAQGLNVPLMGNVGYTIAANADKGPDHDLIDSAPNFEEVVKSYIEDPSEKKLFHFLGTEHAVLQPYENACGYASLLMLFERLAIDIVPNDLQEALDPGPNGKPVSLQQIQDFCSNAGLASAGYRGSITNLKELTQPVLLHVDGHHFVILSKMLENGALILDPGIGRQFIDISQFQKRWDGVYFKVET